MSTHRPELGSPAADLLAVNRAVDAVCDRFEMAWLAGERPRIEAFLDDVPAPQRPHFLRELLLVELALSPPGDRDQARAAALARFPQYPQVVASAVADWTPGPAVASRAAPALDDVIRQAQNRWRRSASSTAPSAASDVMLEGAPVEPTPDDALWRHLARYASFASNAAAQPASPNAERLEQLARQLLDAFPASRRPILSQLLMGASHGRLAQQHGVTERTVESTYRAALDLLARPTPGQPM